MKYIWDGKEVTARQYLQAKFCLCGARNAPEKTMCVRCLKKLEGFNARALGKTSTGAASSAVGE